MDGVRFTVQNDQRPVPFLACRCLSCTCFTFPTLKCPRCSMMHDATCFSLHTCLCALNEDRDLTFFFEIGLMKPWAQAERQQADTDRPVCCCNPVEENKFFIKVDSLCLHCGEDNTRKDFIGTS